MKKIAILMLAVVLSACGNNGGEFEGKWVETNDGTSLMSIERNNNEFLVTISDSTEPADAFTPIPATLKDGKLFLERSGATVTYVKATKTAVVSSMLAGAEFKRVK